jgi:hypothetical protein
MKDPAGFRADILRFLKATRMELGLDEDIYNTLFKFLKENPRYAMRERLEQTIVNVEQMFELPLEYLFPNDIQRSAVVQFKQTYMDFLGQQKSCFSQITELANSLYALLGLVEQLKELLNIIKVCDSAEEKSH